jgi:hypothetical protein
LSLLKRLGTVAVFTGAGLVAVSQGPAQAVVGCPDAPNKCYSTNASPAEVPQSPGAPFTLQINNLSETNSNGLSIGSVNVTIPAGVTVSNPSIPGGTANVVGSTIELRTLGIAPGTSKTMTATVSAENAGPVCWATKAKQANDFNGSGNEFVQNGGCAPSTFYSAKCRALIAHDGCIEKIWHTNKFFSATTSYRDSLNGVALITSTFSNAAIPGPDQAVPFVLYNKRGGTCLALTCNFEVISPKAVSGMAVGSDATLVSTCDGSLCPPTITPYLMFLTNELTGNQFPILPCPLGLPPLTGTQTCGSSANVGPGVQLTTQHLSEDDDWKVGGIAVPGTS